MPRLSFSLRFAASAFIALCAFTPLPAFSTMPMPLPPTGARIAVEPGSTQKICQLIGEVDRETGQPTVNATEARYRFWGTDLGASFEHRGRLFFLFGDTHTTGGLKRKPDRDLLAVSDDQDPEACLRLSIDTKEDGGFRPLDVPGVDGGAFSVPTGGFGAGDSIYIFVTAAGDDGRIMGRSVLARSDDEGVSFQNVREVSRSKFINIAPVPVENAAAVGLPGGGQGVLLWGSGRYRRSEPYLAFLSTGQVEDPGAMRYFAGMDPATGQPVWTGREQDARPLFEESCLGELSVSWNAPLRKWQMLYNCAQPRNRIFLRTADQPWGPWSAPEILFDPQRDGGFCRFMNAGPDACPAVSDPHSPRTAGDPYGPYVIARFTTSGEDGRSARIYFLMSTWNPYTVVLMRSTLRLVPGEIAADTPPNPVTAH